jgi:hypothetical protein
MSTRRKAASQTILAQSPIVDGSTDSPLVFISHDSRDADLAEAFANLLSDASGGVLKSFRSSDRTGTTGIPYGADWYPAIKDKLEVATDVVALLTAGSVGRPWILYEAGLAKGKLSANTPVIGIAFGIPLGDATVGPFAQFQNSPDEEDAITSVVLQLIKRNPQATPREQAVRLQVQAFRTSVAPLLKARKDDHTHKPTPADENTVAKFFEEIKVLVNSVPERVADGLGMDPRMQRMRKRRRFHPMMFEELLHHPLFKESDNGALPLLMAFSMLRDDFPWLYEIGVQFYRASEDGDARAIDRAYGAMVQSIEIMHHGPHIFEFMGTRESEEAGFVLHEIMRFVDRFAHQRKRRLKTPSDLSKKKLP